MAVVDTITALCKRRGFVYPTSDIYGGIGGFWDLGPMGALLAKNIKDAWWHSMVEMRSDVLPLDSAIISNPKVWEASGHITSFSDPLIECKICHERLRADQEDEIALHSEMHKKKGEKPQYTEPKQFNLLFKTFVGTVEGEKSVAYLRGETCQGIYTNFQNVVSSNRVKLPFGIAQIGKAFRNEVTPGKFIFRVREFEQMELEYFVRPEDAEQQLRYWKDQRMTWHQSLGIAPSHLRLRQHASDERAHYAADSWDIEYEFPDWGFKELEGIGNRTDYDLKAHAKYSGKQMGIMDQESQTVIVPYIIEPSLGVSRMMLALLFDSYHDDGKRVYLSLHPKLAPYKAAVFPLLANKPELVAKAREIYELLKTRFMTAWDDRGNIGKRYLAQDEIGTPWCVTVDFETLENGSVTVRDRDTGSQERVKDTDLLTSIQQKLDWCVIP